MEDKNVEITPENTSTTEDTPLKIEKKKRTVVNVLSLKKELDTFKEESKQRDTKIFSALETLLNKDEVNPEPVTEEPAETESEVIVLTKQQRDIFEYYFDPKDGFKANYDINLNVFTIEVPEKFSNVTDAHKALYKQDLRSKKVDPNNILGSMKAWCILVKQNLKYERRIQLKD